MIAILITAIAPMLGLISWKDLEKKIGWGILLLFGGGLCLSKVLTETGTTKFLAESLFLSISGSPTWIVIIACIAVMIFLTEISSNTGSAAIFIPIMIALSDQFSGSVTFALVFVILNVATSESNEGNGYYGAAIALVVLAGALTVGSISLASFNPAVSLSLVALGKMALADLWLHLAPQLLGGGAASLVFKWNN